MQTLKQLQNHHRIISDDFAKYHNCLCDYHGAGFYSLDESGVFIPGKIPTQCRTFISGTGPYILFTGEYGGATEYMHIDYTDPPLAYQL